MENYPDDRGRQLTGTPVGHFIGMLGAFLIPVLEGAPIDLCDVWDPAQVLNLIEREGLSIGGGPPYFITSVLDHPDCTPEHLRHFTTVGLGGSTVPAAVTRRLADLGMFVFRSYGSSEHPSITGSSPSAPEDKRLYTDGNPRPGVEIRLGWGWRLVVSARRTCFRGPGRSGGIGLPAFRLFSHGCPEAIRVVL